MSESLKNNAPIVGASIGALGAAAAALAATLCCIGPAVVAVFGVGGAVAIARLEPYRPYMLAGGVLVLAIGFYMAYRPGGACRGGTCSRRTSIVIRAMLWLSAAAMLVAFLAPYLFS